MPAKPKPSNGPWVSRIAGHADVDPAELVAHDLNWRDHPDAQQAAVRSSIADVGLVKSVVVSKASGRILDGHLRVALAIEDGQLTVPVEYLALSEDEERRVLAYLDSTARMARPKADVWPELVSTLDLPTLDGFDALFATVQADLEALAAGLALPQGGPGLPDGPRADLERPTRPDASQRVGEGSQERPDRPHVLRFSADEWEAWCEFADWFAAHRAAKGAKLGPTQVLLLTIADYKDRNFPAAEVE